MISQIPDREGKKNPSPRAQILMNPASRVAFKSRFPSRYFAFSRIPHRILVKSRKYPARPCFLGTNIWISLNSLATVLLLPLCLWSCKFGPPKSQIPGSAPDICYFRNGKGTGVETSPAIFSNDLKNHSDQIALHLQTIRKDFIRSWNFSLLLLFPFLHTVHFISRKVSLRN